MTAGRPQGRREQIQAQPGDKRYVRRDEAGHFTKDQVNLQRSLRADDRQRAKTVAPRGQGDRGDERRRPSRKKH